MALSVNQKRKLQQTRALLITGTLLGPIYIIFSDGFQEVHPFITSMVMGFLISGVIAIFEIWYLDKGIKHMSFLALVFLRTILYVLLILIIMLNSLIVSRMIRFDLSYVGVLQSEEFSNYIFYQDFYIAITYALVFALSVNFTRMLSRKMGQGVLLSQITGTYFKPVKQERVIMFMNIANSSQISQKLGGMEFHRFLNMLFFDITEPIVHRSGIIYEYVEDLVVITWSMNKGIRNANCIRMFYELNHKLEQLKEKYYTKFGLFPKLKASLHCGTVVRAEIGDVKTQIVLHGDVMNTTSRILDKCHELDKDLLASVQLIYRIEIPKIYDKESVGIISLKGKEKEMELFDVHEKEAITIESA